MKPDDLVFLISSLETLNADWLDGVHHPDDPTALAKNPRGLALLEVAASRVMDGADAATVRKDLALSFSEMIKADKVARTQSQLLAAMLADLLRAELAELRATRNV